MLTGANRKSRLLAAALPLIFIAGAADAGRKIEREERSTVAVTTQARIIIKNARGKTIVVGNDKLDQVIIVANKWVRARDDETAEKIMNDLKYVVDQTGDEISVVSKLPKAAENDHSFWAVVKGEKQGAYIDLTLEVPRRFDVSTSTTSGDVEITRIEGRASVSATSGDVRLREIGGETIVELTSGSIRAGEIGGDLRIASSSGDAEIDRVKGILAIDATSGDVSAFEVGGDALINLITGDLVLKGCLGNVSFNTSSGDAKIVDVMGGVSASSSSGNLNVVILPVGEKEFYLNSSSGDINLYYLPKQDYGFLLDVNTCNGSIQGDMEIKLDEITRRKLKGIVGTGKSRVVIETASGNVSIMERKNGNER